LESYDADLANHHLDAQKALSELIGIAEKLSQLRERTGRTQPTVIT
jgi:phosphoglucomutase